MKFEELFQAKGPVRRQSKKIGRNDLCRCGSGKKFKKCCGKQKRNNNAE